MVEAAKSRTENELHGETGLPRQGSSWTNENCSVQENSSDALHFEIPYTNAYGLHDKLNDLKILIQAQNYKPKLIAVTLLPKTATMSKQHSTLSKESFNL